jgi:hypothetical protein
VKGGVRLEVDLPESAQLLGGFFRSEKKDAAAILRNAVEASGNPAFTVWSHALPAGRNSLDFGRGAYLILGFIKKDAQPEPRMVFFSDSAAQKRPDLDWLFE